MRQKYLPGNDDIETQGSILERGINIEVLWTYILKLPPGSYLFSSDVVFALLVEDTAGKIGWINSY